MVVMPLYFLTPTPRSLSLQEQCGNITTTESAVCAAWGVERLATAWVRMRGRKDGSVGVGRDGCVRSTETKARTELRNREYPHVQWREKKSRKNERGGGDGRLVGWQES